MTPEEDAKLSAVFRQACDEEEQAKGRFAEHSYFTQERHHEFLVARGVTQGIGRVLEALREGD